MSTGGASSIITTSSGSQKMFVSGFGPLLIDMVCKYSQLHNEREIRARTRTRQPHTITTPTRVGALSQSHPGLCGTPVGPGKDTHGTRGPVREKAVGGPSTSHHATRPRQRRDQVYSVTSDEHLKTNMVGAWHGFDFAVREQVLNVGALVLDPREGAFSAPFRIS